MAESWLRYWIRQWFIHHAKQTKNDMHNMKVALILHHKSHIVKMSYTKAIACYWMSCSDYVTDFPGILINIWNERNCWALWMFGYYEYWIRIVHDIALLDETKIVWIANEYNNHNGDGINSSTDIQYSEY